MSGRRCFCRQSAWHSQRRTAGTTRPYCSSCAGTAAHPLPLAPVQQCRQSTFNRGGKSRASQATHLLLHVGAEAVHAQGPDLAGAGGRWVGGRGGLASQLLLGALGQLEQQVQARLHLCRRDRYKQVVAAMAVCLAAPAGPWRGPQRSLSLACRERSTEAHLSGRGACPPPTCCQVEAHTPVQASQHVRLNKARQQAGVGVATLPEKALWHGPAPRFCRDTPSTRNGHRCKLGSQQPKALLPNTLAGSAATPGHPPRLGAAHGRSASSLP